MAFDWGKPDMVQPGTPGTSAAVYHVVPRGTVLGTYVVPVPRRVPSRQTGSSASLSLYHVEPHPGLVPPRAVAAGTRSEGQEGRTPRGGEISTALGLETASL